jgi:hypothetical protein
MKVRTEQKLDAAAKDGLLPPVEWHINNLVQLISRLKASHVDATLFDHEVNNIIYWYQQFLNSYSKVDRMNYLASCRDSTKNLCTLVRATKVDNYTKECIGYIVALHDFALGIAAICKFTNAEPYKDLYNNLEKNAV